MESQLIIIFIALVIPFVYLLIWKSRKPCKNRLPPQAAGAWPVIGHLHLLVGSQPAHVTLGHLADKYGPIFTMKLGVHRTLIISNAEKAKECLTTNDRAFASRPKCLAMEILGFNYAIISFSPYGEYWRQIRKIVTLELLSKHRLEKLKHVRVAEVREAIKGLYKESIKRKENSNNELLVEMRKWFSDITLNVILKIIVGKRYVEYGNQSGGNGDHDEWRDALRDFLELSGKYSVSDAVPWTRWLDLGGVEKEMKKNIDKIDGVLGKWLQERKDKKEPKMEKSGDGDFMDILLPILDDAEHLSIEDADIINKATCLTMILAASDTTAVTLTWALSLLLNNPDALKAAQHELDFYVGRERTVTELDTHNLVYLQAIFKETFRLYPALPLLIQHESLEDCTVDGYHIPTGTRLLINASKIQRDPSVWVNPDEFQPERFLTTHKDVDFRGLNFELIPFGSGRRMCPGILFALQVLNLTLATLLHSFDIEASSGGPVDMTESPGLTNTKATPLEVFLTPRLSPHLY